MSDLEQIQQPRSQFDDSQIQKQLQFQNYYSQHEGPNILNIQNYFSNPSIFQQLLIHLYNLVPQTHPLSTSIHKYLQNNKNPLIDDKRKEIHQLINQITLLKTQKLINEGEQIGLERCKQILEEQINRIDHKQVIDDQNKQLRQKMEGRFRQILDIQKQISELSIHPEKIEIDNKILKQLTNARDTNNKLLNTLHNNQQEYTKLSNTLHSLKSKVIINNTQLKQPVIQQVLINMNKSVVIKRKQDKQIKLTEKYQILDQKLKNRVYWIIAGIFVVIHLLWRKYY